MVLYQRTWCFPFILLQHEFNTNNDQHLNNNNSGDQKETSISLKIFFYFLATRHNINNDRMETPLLVMYVHHIFEQCKSRELITLFA